MDVVGLVLVAIAFLIVAVMIAFGVWVNRRAAYWQNQVKGLVRPAAKRGLGPLTGPGQK